MTAFDNPVRITGHDDGGRNNKPVEFGHPVEQPGPVAIDHLQIEQNAANARRVGIGSGPGQELQRVLTAGHAMQFNPGPVGSESPRRQEGVAIIVLDMKDMDFAFDIDQARHKHPIDLLAFPIDSSNHFKMVMSTTAAIATKPLTILHIEDDHGDALLVSRALSASSLDIGNYVHVDRLSDGLTHLRSNRVDLILLDVNLPDAAVLRFDVVAVRRCSSAPILFVTGLEAAAISDTLGRGRTLNHIRKADVSAELLEAKIASLAAAEPPPPAAAVAAGSDHRFEAVLEAMADPVLVVDAFGQVFWANEAGERLMADNPDQAWTDFFEHGRTLATSASVWLYREGQRRKFEARISELADRSVGNDLFVAVLRHELR